MLPAPNLDDRPGPLRLVGLQCVGRPGDDGVVELDDGGDRAVDVPLLQRRVERRLQPVHLGEQRRAAAGIWGRSAVWGPRVGASGSGRPRSAAGPQTSRRDPGQVVEGEDGAGGEDGRPAAAALPAISS